jgi:hypothetical protein
VLVRRARYPRRQEACTSRVPSSSDREPGSPVVNEVVSSDRLTSDPEPPSLLLLGGSDGGWPRQAQPGCYCSTAT